MDKLSSWTIDGHQRFRWNERHQQLEVQHTDESLAERLGAFAAPVAGAGVGIASAKLIGGSTGTAVGIAAALMGLGGGAILAEPAWDRSSSWMDVSEGEARMAEAQADPDRPELVAGATIAGTMLGAAAGCAAGVGSPLGRTAAIMFGTAAGAGAGWLLGSAAV